MIITSMSSNDRLIPTWPFPEYIFIPGKNPHPKKEGGHMEGEKDPVAHPIDLTHPDKSEMFRYGIDLFNHDYFWESHVYFESLWNAHLRSGRVADFLKALIKLGAAGVKTSIDEEARAMEHYERARELLLEIHKLEGNVFLGFELTTLLFQIDEMLLKKAQKIYLKPLWG